jgi:type I restriction enzyme S subunit
MELRVGYKQTEIGVIPEDWKVISFENAFHFLSTASYSRAEITSVGNIKYVHYGDIHTKLNHFLDFSSFELPHIKKEQLKTYSLIKEGDLIMADASEDYEGIGKSVEVKSIGSNNAISGLHTFLLRGKDDVFSNGFKAYLHSNKIIKHQYDRLATGLKVYGVSKGNLKQIQIPLPPLPEQTAIATVLSDIDNLLQNLEKKIAKKRLIKQGATQELLKPKEGWVVKPLGKFVNFSNGKAHENHIDVNGKYTVVNSKFVSTGGRVFKSASANFSPLKKGDIVMVMSDIPNGKALAKCFLVPKDDKYALNQRICSIRTEEVDTNYLLYILNRNKYYLAFDSGTGQTNLKKNDVLNCPIPLPKTKEEQTKIATILSDMNVEIESLEKKISKYKQVKQGLMQNLLTGKIRLV